MEDLRGFTLWRPMSFGIVHGTKRIENRPWAPPPWIVGRWIAIHGGKKWDDGYADMVADIMHLDELPPAARDTGIVGLARVTGYVTESDDPWYIPGQYGWTLDQVAAFSEPVPCRGAQGLWRVPDEIRSQVLNRARWAAARQYSLHELRDALEAA